MTIFRGTAICQFNVDVEVDAEDSEKAEEKIYEVLEENFVSEFSITGDKGYIFEADYDECFEVLDIEEVKGK